MKARKLAKKKKAVIKGGYETKGRPGSNNIYDRRPGSINIGPNYNNWVNGDRRIESGVNVRSEMGTGRDSGEGSGSNRARSGRGSSV